MAIRRLSTWAFFTCRDPLFWRYLQVADEKAAVEVLRKKCGIASRSELDTDQAAAARFDEIIRRPYTDFYNRQENTCSKLKTSSK